MGKDDTDTIVKESGKHLDDITRLADAAKGKTPMTIGQVEVIEMRLRQRFYAAMNRLIGSELENRVLKERCVSDGLTGITNRMAFALYLREVLNQSEKVGKGLDASLITIDGDFFKEVNDRYGHGKGDEVLIKLAGLLPSAARAYDHLFIKPEADNEDDRFYVDLNGKTLEVLSSREGGEEFAIVLPNTGFEGAQAAAKRVVDKVRESFKDYFEDLNCTPLPGKEPLHGFTVSVGYATTRTIFTDLKGHTPMKIDIGYDERSLVRAADLGRYKAKREGRDRSCTVCEKKE